MKNSDTPCESVIFRNIVQDSNEKLMSSSCKDPVNETLDAYTYETDHCVVSGTQNKSGNVTDHCFERPTSFPPEPVKPLDSDCCGSGCTPCVFDIYDQEMKIWKKECERLKQKLDPQCQKEFGPLLLKEEYRKFMIKEIIPETHDSKRFRMELPNGRSLGLKVGQHVIFRGIHEGQIITRQYTPTTDVNTEGYFDLLIKIYKEGKMSAYVNSLVMQSQIELRGPYGEYSYIPNKVRCLWMFAAGTGIAPMAQLIQGVLNNEEDDTIIRLYYACKTYEEILLRKELQDWRKYWNFSVDYILSQIHRGVDPGQSNTAPNGYPSQTDCIDQQNQGDVERCLKNCFCFGFHSKIKFSTLLLIFRRMRIPRLCTPTMMSYTVDV